MQPTGIYLDTIKAMGGNPTPMDFKEVYTSMQTGVIDGQENPLNVIATRAFYEVQGYLVLTGHITQNQVVLISEKTYQSLTPDQQQALVAAAREAGDYQNKVLADDETGQLELVQVERHEGRRAGRRGLPRRHGRRLQEVREAPGAPASSSACATRSSSAALDVRRRSLDAASRRSSAAALAAGTALALAGVAMFAQVIARFVFNAPFIWAEEFATLLFAWITSSARRRVQGDDSHLSIDTLRSSPAARRGRRSTRSGGS